MVRLAIRSPLANCLVVTGCTSIHPGPYPDPCWLLQQNPGALVEPQQSGEEFAPFASCIHSVGRILLLPKEHKGPQQWGVVGRACVQSRLKSPFTSTGTWFGNLPLYRNSRFVPGETLWFGQQLKLNSLLHP